MSWPGWRFVCRSYCPRCRTVFPEFFSSCSNCPKCYRDGVDVWPRSVRVRWITTSRWYLPTTWGTGYWVDAAGARLSRL